MRPVMRWQGQGNPNRFQHNLGEVHWTAVKTILKYLRNIKDMVLVYRGIPKIELKVTFYADADFQTDKDDTKSQLGYVFVLNGGAVDWKSAKQGTSAMSSTELSTLLQLRHQSIAIDPRIMKGARHYQRKYHYIREVIQAGEIVLKKVHTDNNLADRLQSQCHITSILNML
ncbi:hypothetical protein Tco_0038547 [Tanacetum coccineum]